MIWRRKNRKPEAKESPARNSTPAMTAPPEPSRPDPAVDPEEMERKIIDELRTVFDPEIPVNIYELGLVYGIQVDPSGAVVIRMTLTSPGCPVAVTLPVEVESRVKSVPGVTSAVIDLVWDPPWNPDRMTDAARLQLGFF